MNSNSRSSNSLKIGIYVEQFCFGLEKTGSFFWFDLETQNAKTPVLQKLNLKYLNIVPKSEKSYQHC